MERALTEEIACAKARRPKREDYNLARYIRWCREKDEERQGGGKEEEWEQIEKEGEGDGESSGQGQIKTCFVEDLL